MIEPEQPVEEERPHYVFTPEEIAFLSRFTVERAAIDARMQTALLLIAEQQKLKGKYEVDASGTKLIPVPEKK